MAAQAGMGVGSEPPLAGIVALEDWCKFPEEDLNLLLPKSSRRP